MEVYDHIADWAGVDPDAPFHEFLLPRRKSHGAAGTEPLREVVELRKAIDSFPATKATFTVRQVLGDDANHPLITEDLLEFVGSWRVPEGMGKKNSTSYIYVNPEYVHAHRYSDLDIECQCGALMVQGRCWNGEGRSGAEVEHNDGCRMEFQHRALARVLEKRRAIALRMLHFGVETTTISPRLGYRRDSTLSEQGDTLGFTVSEEKEEGRLRTARTAARLCYVYKADTVGLAYGCSGRRIRELLNEYTDRTGQEYYEQRKRFNHQ